MHYPKSLDRCQARVEQLEQRVSSVLETVQQQLHDFGTSSQAIGSGATENAAWPQRSADAPTPALQNGNSLFEIVLEQVVQGYRNDERYEAVVEDHLAATFADSIDPVCFIHMDGTIQSANTSFSKRIGEPVDRIVGEQFFSFVEETHKSRLQERLAEASEGQDSGPVSPDKVIVFRLIGANGKKASVAALLIPCTRYTKDSELHAVVMRDLSVHKNLLEQLQESRDNYDALSETMAEAILRINQDLEIVFANSAVRSTFGFEPEELQGRPFSTIFPESVYDRNKEIFRRYFVVDDGDRARLGMENTVELLGRHKNRGVAPMEISFGNSKEYRGRTLTCIVRDITQRKNVERRLRQLAYHDQLTGLGNRDLFEIEMKRVIGTPELFESGYSALLFLDLDGFKQVNDTLGHDAGDQLLVETASRLRRTLRENDSVYRFGGDEFVVLLNYVHERRGAAVVANNILGEIRRPFELSVSEQTGASGSRATVSVGVSIGIAIIPDDGSTIAAATKAGDLAMYSAKEGGRNHYAFYNQKLDARAHGRWELEQGIRTSLENQEFEMHYQPLVDEHGALCGLEALLRWYSASHGYIPPDKFMPVAEDTGMIVPLGGWAIETAFRDALRWPSVAEKPLFVSVNISPRQFDRSDLLESIGRVITQTGIDPHRVILELTESCIMTAPERSIATLQALKDRYPGLQIAIDDFGTGYSSLSYLTRLPSDIIKIDISFVSNLFELNNEKIVRSIINLGHSLGLRVIAEGVETDEQFAYFADKKCFAFQGFHFHRPMPADDVTAMVV